MSRGILLPLVIAIVVLGWSAAVPAVAQTTTAISYQGSLGQNGQPVTGSADFIVGICGDPTRGLPMETVTLRNVSVTDGLFTLSLDFDAGHYDGDGLWLEIKVAYPAGSGYVTLTPRQAIQPTAYANCALTSETLILPYRGTAPAGATDAFTITQANADTAAIVATATGTDGVGVEATATSATGYAGWFDGRSYFSGQVGIGTDAPNTMLDVRSPVSGTAIQGINPGESTEGALGHEYAGVYGLGPYAGYFEGMGYFSGNVGIGISNPWHKLMVAGNVMINGDKLYIGREGADAYIELHSDEAADSTEMHIKCLDTVGLAITNSTDAELLVIHQQGNVGIGTTTPGHPLEVAGRVKASSLQIGNSATAGHVLTADASGVGTWQAPPAGGGGLWNELGSDIYFSGGDVGIGTAYPSAKLDVIGTVEMSGFKMPTGAATGRVLTSDASGNGSWQAPTGGGGLTLPYSDSVSSSSAAFAITNTGTSMTSHAISAKINSASSHSDASAGYFSATGSNGGAIYATGDGMSTIRVQHSGNSHAVWGSSGGSGGAYFSCSSVDGVGVKGRAAGLSGTDTVGGWFESSSSSGKGVYAYSDGVYAQALRAESAGAESTGIYAESPWIGMYVKSPHTAAKFKGDVQVAEYSGTNIVFSVDTGTGVTNVDVLHITGGADLAEKFEFSESATPGMVVEIDPDHPGQMRLARGAYNRRVAGVISGANDLGVGMVLADLPGAENAQPVALSGRAWVYCDATERAITPGDLLTTAERPGHAMAVGDHDRAHGAVLGKAMSKLERGRTGLVLVLVNLQ